MDNENLFKKLKENLQDGNVKQSSDLLISIYNKYGEDWISYIKLNGVLPEPLSHTFSTNTLATFMKSLQSIVPKIEIRYIEDILTLVSSLLRLYNKVTKINERLSESEFFNFPPVKQLQMFSVFMEDQSRMAQGEIVKRMKNPELLTPMDLIRADLESDLTKTKVSVIDNIEGIGDSIDLNLRYIFWKYGNDFDGIHSKDVSPYNLKSFHELLVWAYMRVAIDNLWQNIKYRNWRHLVRNDVAYYYPPDQDLYIKEEISVDRYRLYENELTNHILSGPLRQEFRLFNNILSKIDTDIGSVPWYPDVPIRQMRQLLSMPAVFEVSLAELFSTLYKRDIDNLLFGPPNRQVNGKDFLEVCKYIFILSSIYQKKSWESIDIDGESQYCSLIPVLNENTLVDTLSQATGWSREECMNALDLLCFNPQNTKLDIWLQPLIPIGKSNYLLIPVVGKSMKLIRLFEAHMLQWNIGFDDRGLLFEEEIRNRLKEAKIPVVSHSIRFNASDGKKVEYDIISCFGDYLILIEAKCLRTPYSPIDRYNCWKEIDNGIEQLRRRRDIISSDWNRIFDQADIDLPEIPPEKDKILCLLITNIFTFTGVEVDNIRVSDLTCFYRYLSGPNIEGTEFDKNGVIRRFIAERIWAGKEPTPTELWKYIHNPLGLRNITDKTKIEFEPILPFNEKDKNVFCVPNVIVGN